MNSNLHTLFQQPSPFAGASEGVVNFILNHGQFKTYSVGKRLYLSGERSEGFWGIVEGRIRLSKTSEKGNDLTIRDFHSGDWFGFISYFAELKSPHDAIVLEKSQLIYMPSTTVELLFSSFPELYRSTLNTVSGAFIRLAHLHYDTVNYSLLVRTVQIILRISMLTNSEELNLSQSDVASFVGASREAVSGQLKSLENQNAICIGYRKIIIVDKEKLQVLAGGEDNWIIEQSE